MSSMLLMKKYGLVPMHVQLKRFCPTIATLIKIKLCAFLFTCMHKRIQLYNIHSINIEDDICMHGITANIKCLIKLLQLIINNYKNYIAIVCVLYRITIHSMYISVENIAIVIHVHSVFVPYHY